MVIWIVVGSLVFIVATFLVVMSIRDKKKSKIIKLEEGRIEILRNKSRENVIIFLNQLIIKNSQSLKEFVPSIGKLKMGDIRNMAKRSFLEFKKYEEYKLASDSDKNKSLMNVFLIFEKENSNVWDKRLKKEIRDVKAEVLKIDKDFIKEYSPKIESLLKKVYK